MELFRLHAYGIVPQRTADESDVPAGGAVRITNELKGVLEENEISARLNDQPLVDFLVDSTSRTNDVRDAVMAFAFGEPARARAAAQSLAGRLATSMDRRSASCLLVPAGYRDSDSARVVLWVFPRDAAFQLRIRGDTPSVDVLKNVFSQTSHLRKGAAFQGKERRTDFLKGRVLDHQAKSTLGNVADFWIGRFLQCTLSLRGEAGSRMLGRVVRKAYEACEESQAREQLQAAVMAVRHSPNRRISLQTFADQYLDGEARQAFLASAPNDYNRTALFDFERTTFENVLQFMVYQLENGVYVSSPLSQVGQAVQISGTDEKRLSCSGKIVEEKMRTRHA